MLHQSRSNDDDSQDPPTKTTRTSYHEWVSTSIYEEPPKRFYAIMTNEEAFFVTYLMRLVVWIVKNEIRRPVTLQGLSRMWIDMNDVMSRGHFHHTGPDFSITQVATALERRDLLDRKDVDRQTTYIRLAKSLWRTYLKHQGIIQ